MVEHIAREPGHSRAELARRFALGERQVQADLAVIRERIGLPLVRRRGYRFEGAAAGRPEALTLAEALLLLELLRRAAIDQLAPPETLLALSAKLSNVVPPHLQSLVRTTLSALPVSTEQQPALLLALATAMVGGQLVCLHYPPGDPSTHLRDPLVMPELLVPYLRSWYVVGRCQQRGRVMVFDLANVSAVSVASDL